MGFKTDWLSDCPQAAHDYVGILQWVPWTPASCNLTLQFTWTQSVTQVSFAVKAHKYIVCFSDAFDLQYGVAVLRMRERLDVSRPSELHGEKWLELLCVGMSFSIHCSSSCAKCSLEIMRYKIAVHISVNSGFDGSPENIHIISAAPRVKTSTTCT